MAVVKHEAPSDEDRAQLRLAPLPAAVQAILDQETAPPRLYAHLTLVQSSAAGLLARIKKAWPQLDVDSEAVIFGAATHDIGKARHVEELSQPGTRHEAAGRLLLLEHGVSAHLARFAETHGQVDTSGLTTEDLLVIAADTVWKAKRSRQLDDLLVKTIVEATKAPAWDVFMRLDGILGALSKGADERLEWHEAFACSGAGRPSA